MTKPTYQERIDAAYETGHLFAHMFEGEIEQEWLGKHDHSIKYLFDIMAQKPGITYKTVYRHHFNTTEHGVLGLATTALKKGYPVPLFREQSYVGLLMDSAKPLVVSNCDSMSMAEGENQRIRISRFDHQPEIFDVQGIAKPDNPTNSAIWVDLQQNLSTRFEQAEQALAGLWDYIARMGWDTYVSKKVPHIQGMNEVNVAAKLGDICGIAVYDNANLEKRKTLMGDVVPYAESVRTAVRLRDHLMQTYPGHFTEPLPIVAYSISKNAEPSMQVLDDKAIEAILAADIPGGQAATVTPQEAARGLGS